MCTRRRDVHQGQLMERPGTVCARRRVRSSCGPVRPPGGTVATVRYIKNGPAVGNEVGIASARHGTLPLLPAHLCVASPAETWTWAWWRRYGCIPGRQGVAGSNPAVPTFFRTLVPRIGNEVWHDHSHLTHAGRAKHPSWRQRSPDDRVAADGGDPRRGGRLGISVHTADAGGS